MTRHHALWIVPVLVTVHNAEEALALPRFLPAWQRAMPSALRSLLPSPTYGQYLFALVVVTAIPWLIAAFGNLGKRTGVAAFLLLLLMTVMGLNAFWHIAAAGMLHGYAPGIVTAIAFNLLYAAYLIRRAFVERWFPRPQLALMFPLALLVHGPLLLGLLLVANEVVGR